VAAIVSNAGGENLGGLLKAFERVGKGGGKFRQNGFFN
jgi:hypothetical protein